MKIGDVVVPRGTKVLASGCGIYNCAIIVSIYPFVLVSVEGDMLWAKTVHEYEFMSLCQADKEIVDRAAKRYKDYIDS